jgi:single-stranded-DNA-specific exonuclease
MALKFHWSLAPAQPALVAHLATHTGVSPLLAQCLLNRGHSEPACVLNFLQPRLKQLADPMLLPNIDRAVDRLFCARERGERVVIFGDYDVDGVTSTALLIEVMQALGWKVDYYLPHRLEEGYGLSQEGVENCLVKFNTTLLLAVDCGSTAITTIDWLRQHGVDVLVLDHHQVSVPQPNATALVNPQLECAGRIGFRELCSVGLAFKLAHALVKRLRHLGLNIAHDLDLRPLLDLVALGTIADLVPLTGENRILVSAGLQRLNTTQRPGLVALKAVAGIEDSVGIYEVGFQLAPRLNAAGRLENATAALRLLLATDRVEAETLATELDYRNRERQQIERSIVEEVIGGIRSRFDPETDFVIVEGRLLWHIGVVGIVASRVLREFYRPTIIIGGDGTEWRGSGRSIQGFDLAAALGECHDLLVRHGGHPMAAGLSIAPENIDLLRTRLNQLVRRTLKSEELQPTLRLDAEVSLAQLSFEQLRDLDRLKPTGQGNPAVQLVVRQVSHQRPPQRVGKDQQHAKFRVTDGTATIETVWWGANEALFPTGSFDLAFEPQINEFNGQRSVQLKLLAWRS